MSHLYAGDLDSLPAEDGSKRESFFVESFSKELVDRFALANTWRSRQSYAYVVGQIIQDGSLPPSVVSSTLFPAFFALANDKVANIRLVVAKILQSYVLNSMYTLYIYMYISFFFFSIW